jgi:PilZ domain
MEQEHKKRIHKKLLIKVDGQSCVMEDMSRNGMKLVIPVLLKKRQVTINFRMEPLELEMQGYVRWIHKEPTVYDQAQYQVGLYITDPPDEYITLVENLLESPATASN